MLRSISRAYRSLPTLMRVGMLIFLVGGLFDLVYHAGVHDWAEAHFAYAGDLEEAFHLVALLGMIITMLGLFTSRLTQRRESPVRISPDLPPPASVQRPHPYHLPTEVLTSNPQSAMRTRQSKEVVPDE